MTERDLPAIPTPTALAMARLRWCAEHHLPDLASDALAELVEPMDTMTITFGLLTMAMSGWMEDQTNDARHKALAAALQAFEVRWSAMAGPNHGEAPPVT